MTDADVDAELVKLATQTYIYGYPLVYDLEETTKVYDGTSPLVTAGRPNAFAPARSLLGPDAEFVSPNNDTLYLIAACDVSAEPLVLRVPDTHDRYYVLQFVDAWSNNFAYVGRRATGTGAGQYLLAPTGYSGPVPDDTAVVEAPSTIFTIVGRIQVDGDADLPAVHALQDAFSLDALSAVTATTPPGPGRGLPVPDSSVVPDLEWWERFRVSLAAFPPPAGDAEFVDAAARLGLTAPDSLYVDPDPALAAALIAGRKQADELMETLSRTTIKIIDGWASAMHAFDYNLDRLGLGTIDTPEWKIADRTTAYVTRAVAARMGLWGNHGYEAQYDILWQDEHGDELDGSRTYEVTLSPAPPVDAFWSLTMYDEPDYYLVANAIDRFSIGDRTPGLVVAPDGSVTISMQHAPPGGERDPNWLPAPAGRFRPILRSYQPQAAILSGDYKLPKVRRLS